MIVKTVGKRIVNPFPLSVTPCPCSPGITGCCQWAGSCKTHLSCYCSSKQIFSIVNFVCFSLSPHILCPFLAVPSNVPGLSVLETDFKNRAILYSLKLEWAAFKKNPLFQCCSFPPTWARCAKLKLAEFSIVLSTKTEATEVWSVQSLSPRSCQCKSYYLGFQLAQCFFTWVAFRVSRVLQSNVYLND